MEPARKLPVANRRSYLNAAGQTAVMMAALFDRRRVIELLFDAGADIDAADAAGNTAAALALVQGNEDLAQWLSTHRTQQPLP